MKKEIQSNELIEGNRVSVVKETSDYLTDLQELSKAINAYTQAKLSNDRIPDDNPNKAMFIDTMEKAKAEFDLQMAFVATYTQGD